MEAREILAEYKYTNARQMNLTSTITQFAQLRLSV
jgi:hypothetical protein